MRNCRCGAERFGFRTIEFGPDFGFRLNGRKVWLQGIANHADYGAVGCAATLLAVDDGDPNTDLLFKGVDEKPLMDGSLLAILRAKPAVGAVTLTATAAHLPPLTVDLMTVK